MYAGPQPKAAGVPCGTIGGRIRVAEEQANIMQDNSRQPTRSGAALGAESAVPRTWGERYATPLLYALLGLLAVIVVFALGAGVGFGFGRLSNSGRVAAAAIATGAGDTVQRADLEANFATFWEAMDVLYENFYGDLPDGKAGTYDAIRGVVGQLGDPNTSFLTPDEANVFRTNIQGSFEGIGARVDWDEDADTVRIVEPFENQPAWNAGLRRGDLILAIDGESVVGTDLTSAVARIRGARGSTATLTILRPPAEGEAASAPFDVKVERATIESPTVTTEALGADGEIGYIRLYTFNENAGALTKQAVEDAVARGAKGIILDLRGNSGGLLREAVKLTSLFVGDAVVLNERFKDGAEEVYRSSGSPVTTALPLVLLVDEGSASASEIVAGALQDAGRATLVGATTFGKGSVQIPQTLSDGSIMRVTIARWYTPNNRTIDGTGLTPDVLVAFTDGERAAVGDPQRDRALQELQTRIAEEAALP